MFDIESSIIKLPIILSCKVLCRCSVSNSLQLRVLFCKISRRCQLIRNKKALLKWLWVRHHFRCGFSSRTKLLVQRMHKVASIHFSFVLKLHGMFNSGQKYVRFSLLQILKFAQILETHPKPLQHVVCSWMVANALQIILFLFFQ